MADQIIFPKITGTITTTDLNEEEVKTLESAVKILTDKNLAIPQDEKKIGF